MAENDEDLLELHREIGALESENNRLMERVAQLETQLAEIKPSWDDAPSWADRIDIQSFWVGFELYRNKNGDYYVPKEEIYDFWERRPGTEEND